MPISLPSGSARNFVLQQGLAAPDARACSSLTSALLFQARAVGLWGLLGTILDSGAIYAALAIVLWWSALLPQWNPFDELYNRTLGARPNVPRLDVAPSPRRFAQGIAGTFAASIAASLLAHWSRTALVIQVAFFLAIGALIFAKFCLGSFVFHVLRGNVVFALRTLPWGRGA
jgi:hypothetical protein